VDHFYKQPYQDKATKVEAINTGQYQTAYGMLESAVGGDDPCDKQHGLDDGFERSRMEEEGEKGEVAHGG